MKNLFEEILRIRHLSGFIINENTDSTKWDTIFRWIEIFSTDNGKFLNSKNITSGLWLKKAFENNEITTHDIDLITRDSNGIKFSELPMVKNLIK